MKNICKLLFIQISGVHTVDTTIKEDSVTLARYIDSSSSSFLFILIILFRITYGIKPSGSIVYMNKDGGGSLDLLNIRSMAKVCFYLFEKNSLI